MLFYCAILLYWVLVEIYVWKPTCDHLFQTNSKSPLFRVIRVALLEPSGSILQIVRERFRECGGGIEIRRERGDIHRGTESEEREKDMERWGEKD